MFTGIPQSQERIRSLLIPQDHPCTAFTSPSDFGFGLLGGRVGTGQSVSSIMCVEPAPQCLDSLTP